MKRLRALDEVRRHSGRMSFVTCVGLIAVSPLAATSFA